MDLRLVIGSLLFVGTTAAQITPLTPATPAAPAPAGSQEPAKQDPDKPQPTPAQQVDELNKEKARLQREIDYAKERAGNAKALLREKFAPRKNTHRSIDAGVMAPPAPPPQMVSNQPRAARIASADDLGNQPQGTMLTVNGRPVSQSSFDQLQAYLEGAPNSGDAAMRAQRALFELIRIEAVASVFEDNEAAERTGEAVAQLEAGKSMADVQKAFAVVPGAGEGGTIEVTRNSVFGPLFEMVAFNTADGKRSRPFRTANGLVVLQIDKREKGASPELDKVIGSAVLVAYSNEPEQMNKAQMAVTTGQVDIVVRDQQTLEMLPAIFRPAPAPIVPANVDEAVVAPGSLVPGQVDPAKVKARLEQIAAELSKPLDPNDPSAKAVREQLQKQYAELKQMLRGGEQAPPKVEPGKQVPATPVAPKEGADVKKKG